MALWRVMPQASVDDERKIGRKGILATESTTAKLEAKLEKFEDTVTSIVISKEKKCQQTISLKSYKFSRSVLTKCSHDVRVVNSDRNVLLSRSKLINSNTFAENAS